MQSVTDHVISQRHTLGLGSPISQKSGTPRPGLYLLQAFIHLSKSQAYMENLALEL
jgi:hypothetical protein